MRLISIILAWAAYAALHSLLASLAVKAWVGRRWPGFMPAYRLAFNAVSLVALLPVLWLVYGAEAAWLWQWHGGWAWLANGLAAAALVGFAVSSRSYDMDEFLGLRQLKEHGADDRQRFTLSAFHRFVRHPWYALGLVLIWTRDMNGPLLVSAAAITLYFVIGSRLEERKLVAHFGDAYRRYMEKVPGLVPLPWKWLTRAEAAALMEDPGHR